MDKPLTKALFACACAAALALCAALCACGTAFADEGQGEAQQGPSGTVHLIVVPNLGWDDIDNETTPTLQYLASRCAVANVITEYAVDIDALEGEGNLDYHYFDDVTWEFVDNYVNWAYGSLEEGDSLIVTSSPALTKGKTYTLSGYGMMILVDKGDNGFLWSSTVRRTGLITSGDAGGAIAALLHEAQRNPANISTTAFSADLGAIARTEQLERDDNIAVSVRGSRDEFIVVWLIVLGITSGCSVVLLFLDARSHPAFLEHILPATRILWIVALSCPLASFAMLANLPVETTVEIAFDYFGFTLMAIAFVCLIVALVSRWWYALCALLGATVFILLFDQLIGGPLTATGYLSYQPIDTTRYYGIGNQGAALAFGAWILLASLVLNRAKPDGRFAKNFRKWGFATGSAVVIAIIAAPWWGSNFGVLIWGIVGAAVAWELFVRMRITWKHVAIMFVAACALAFAVMALDSTFSGESHIGASSSLLSSTWYIGLVDMFGDMARLSWETVAFSPALSVAFVFILVFLIWLRVRKPGPYQTFWDENVPFKSGYTTLLITSVIMLFVEDSGILMPALGLLYNMAGLVWVLCDQHSWHIRKWLGQRILVRESQ